MLSSPQQSGMVTLHQPTGQMLRSSLIETPLGPVRAISDGLGIRLLEFDNERRVATQMRAMHKYDARDVEPGTDRVLDQLEAELRRYFAGSLREFTVPLAAPGTGFQESVWRVLRGIPYGRTWSYAQVAEAIGRPTAVRAVARANGDNRVAIIIPCHRVIGSDGSMTGYAAGIQRKQWLLAHERGEPVNGLWAVGA